MAEKVAIVTGSNKGIGLAIVKGLCEKYDGVVYLTSRNAARGEEAVSSLRKLGLNPQFYQLDVDNSGSINAFCDYIKEKHGGVDVLINNAGIAFSHSSTESFGHQAEHTLRTNYFSLLTMCNAFAPILRQNAQVVNVSSSLGHLSKIPSESLRKQLSDPQLTEGKLNDLMNQFITDAKNGTNVENGWGTSTYNVSKVGVSALTRVQQRNFDEETPNRNISVNSVHPGYVDTDMTAHRGVLTVEQGARAPLYLALESHGLKGQFVWFDCTVVDWTADSTPYEALTK